MPNICTHEKSQNTKHSTSSIEDDWTKSIPTYYKNYNDFKIGNFQITHPAHYVYKNIGWTKTRYTNGDSMEQN